ncbi:MAG: hypothetical protein C9356_12370 [Oleiphilus sp.]|nr:MAG: hypothetical protein C9356_12370 [Oleiphilus sp.]
MARFLSDSGYVTSLSPVIEPTDLQWMINNKIHLRHAEIAIARPRNPELFQRMEHDFNNSIVTTLTGTGTAMLKIEIRGDAKSTDPECRYLAQNVKRAFREMQANFDVRKCKLLLEHEDSHITHPVDLVLDRLIFQKDIAIETRYPPLFEIWEALTEARTEKEEELRRYFGSLERMRLT